MDTKLGGALLALSSFPIHLLYNSEIFKTLDANLYNAILATPAFLLEDDSSSTQWTGVQDAHNAYLADVSSFDRLDPSECIATYGTSYVSGYNDVILITNDQLPSTWAANATTIPVWNSELLVPGDGNDIPPYNILRNNCRKFEIVSSGIISFLVLYSLNVYSIVFARNVLS